MAPVTGNVRATWSQLLGSLWFVPGAIVLTSVLLAVGMVELSAHVDPEALARWPRVFGASAESSRSMLEAIASSMITVAGVTFSITMVAVTQASSQYTPRILRNFMRDRANQVVLGAFVGIFAYCLVVLRTIRGAEELRFVPALAVLLGVLLAIVGIGVLIFFVHHISSTLQASGIVARVTHDTIVAVDRLFPDEVGVEAPDGATAALLGEIADAAWRHVPAGRTGYIQHVDAEGMLDVAARHACVVRMARGVGDFVIEGTPIAHVARREVSDPPRSVGRDAELAAAVIGLYTVSSYRTVEQDAAFGIRQLVDVALKALSPGVNDTTTAVTCVDYLGAILVRVAGRRVEAPYRSEDGELRVIARGPTFESLLRVAVDEVRQNAGANVSVLARLLDMLTVVAECTHARRRLALLREQVDLLHEVIERTVPAEHDRARLETLAGRARDVIDRRSTT